MEENLSAQKRLLFAVIMVLVVILSVEVLMRAYLATRVGPGILWYGTRFHSSSNPFTRYKGPVLNNDNRRKRTAQDHFNVKYADGKSRRYSKYFPNEKKIDIDENGELHEVTINGLGFRGRDVQLVKGPGVVRVVTLGASSTFGYSNRDHDTYPYQLEKVLNQEADGSKRYEVVNLGIPHLTSDEIHAVFTDEALRLNADVVTLYEGFNDAGSALTATYEPNFIKDVVHEICDTFISAKFMVEVVFRGQDWFVPESEQKEMLKRAPQKFLGNAQRIYDECLKRGIYFIIATQPSKSLFIPREELGGVTYQQEEEILRERGLDERRPRWEFIFLTHMSINRAIRSWATEDGIPFVDVLELMSSKRDLLQSWVHPSPKGNRLIAEALAKPILKYEEGRAPAEKP